MRATTLGNGLLIRPPRLSFPILPIPLPSLALTHCQDSEFQLSVREPRRWRWFWLGEGGLVQECAKEPDSAEEGLSLLE